MLLLQSLLRFHSASTILSLHIPTIYPLHILLSLGLHYPAYTFTSLTLSFSVFLFYYPLYFLLYYAPHFLLTSLYTLLFLPFTLLYSQPHSHPYYHPLSFPLSVPPHSLPSSLYPLPSPLSAVHLTPSLPPLATITAIHNRQRNIPTRFSIVT